MGKDKLLNGLAWGVVGAVALAFITLIVYTVVVSGVGFLAYMAGVGLFIWSLSRVTKKW